MRSPLFLHTASEPLALFGRDEELASLDAALSPSGASVVALVGPGGQGKTAIVQTWLQRLPGEVDGVLFWSFYRNTDAELCLRTWLGYAEGRDAVPEVSAAYAAERLVGHLRGERWAVVLDGVEVVQHEGDWLGRFIHPDMSMFLADLAQHPIPGAVVLTSRFALPELHHRPYFRVVELERLDPTAARSLLQRVGVHGDDAELDAVAQAAGRHAKAVELAGTLLARYFQGQADANLFGSGEDDLEAAVARVLAVFSRHLSEAERDVIALATSFRSPPSEALLSDFLASEAVGRLLRERWQRKYPLWQNSEKIQRCVQSLIELRLLERVGQGVIDAHPLVRRGFEHGSTATARAGFLRGRPDRRRPASLEEVGPWVEQFHAHIEAGHFDEADALYVRLENPKHRLLAPGLEVSLLERFFPDKNVCVAPLWPGFGRWRSLAIALEMLGRYNDALAVYRPGDAGLRGDALLALGRFEEIVEVGAVPAPWNNLWQAYRAHALARLGRVAEAVALARRVVPVDIYEWLHVAEALRLAGLGQTLDLRGLPAADDSWTGLAVRRLRADLGRVSNPAAEYRALIEAYDRAGLAYERTLVRLRLAALTGESRNEAEALIEGYGLVGLRGVT
jgi:tetratricopeptide (TPR) repeat protein